MAKGLSIILGLGKPKGKMPSSGSMPATEEAADDYYSLACDALKEGDKEAFKEALKGAINECMGDNEGEE